MTYARRYARGNQNPNIPSMGRREMSTAGSLAASTGFEMPLAYRVIISGESSIALLD